LCFEKQHPYNVAEKKRNSIRETLTLDACGGVAGIIAESLFTVSLQPLKKTNGPKMFPMTAPEGVK
jgi:hypothetical protein